MGYLWNVIGQYFMDIEFQNKFKCLILYSFKISKIFEKSLTIIRLSDPASQYLNVFN